MIDEQERAALANEARLDAKAFRENTVYNSEGDPIRLIANADRLDQYADRIEALEAENARLREALQLIAGATTGVYIGPDAILDGVKRAARAALGASHDADA